MPVRFLAENFIGKRFHRLEVIAAEKPKIRKNGQKMQMVRVRCDCGTVKVLELTSIRRKDGPTRSCGCYHKEQVAEFNRIHNPPKKKPR